MKWSNFFLIVIFLILLYILVGCSTCPGAANLTYPRFYPAHELMKYEQCEECILSKMNSYEPSIGGYTGWINETDELVIELDAENCMDYFRLNHHASGEELQKQFGTYIQFFRLWGADYKYISRTNFKCVYLIWDVNVSWNPESVQVVAHKTGRQRQTDTMCCQRGRSLFGRFYFISEATLAGASSTNLLDSLKPRSLFFLQRQRKIFFTFRLRSKSYL